MVVEERKKRLSSWSVWVLMIQRVQYGSRPVNGIEMIDYFDQVDIVSSV